MMSDISWELAQTYVAGKTREAALRVAQEWNRRGASVILNFLGEHLRMESAVVATVEEYLTLIFEMQKAEVQGSVAVKPSQLGLELELGYEKFAQNLNSLLEMANDTNIFVWIDMEQPRSVGATLEVFRDVLKDFRSDSVGVCVQANLRRTPQDLETLVERGARLRLVKGVYHGTPEELLPPGPQVDNAFRQLMTRLFETSSRFALGTHDPGLIEEALSLNQKWQRDVEWEMLMGVTVERQLELLTRGIPFGLYVPYGKDGWESYVRRRLLERRQSGLH